MKVDDVLRELIKAACQSAERCPFTENIAMTVRTVSGAEYYGDLDTNDIENGFLTVVTKYHDDGLLQIGKARAIIRIDHIESVVVDEDRMNMDAEGRPKPKKQNLEIVTPMTDT